jgi:hypothetical protein
MKEAKVNRIEMQNRQSHDLLGYFNISFSITKKNTDQYEMEGLTNTTDV